MEVYKEEISVRGKTVKVDAMRIDNKAVIVQGTFLKIARMELEWYENIEDPALLIETLKKGNLKADIFTFWQRLPETHPKHNYCIEWNNVAAIPIKDYNYWFKKQLDPRARPKVRKAAKKGVVVREAEFNDEFIQGMTRIFNETPIRQGKPFWHYGKDFETVKREFSQYLFRENHIGAYYNNELIGFLFLTYRKRYTVIAQIISKIEHRDKALSNALIAKSVEICAKKKIPYLIYSQFNYGKKASSTLDNFKRHNGFEKILLPTYYIPLTTKGKIILKLKLHRGIKEILPEKLMLHLFDLRARWNARKCAQK